MGTLRPTLTALATALWLAPPIVAAEPAIHRPGVVDDGRRWFTAHGATTGLDSAWSGWGCLEIQVGTSGEDALLCTETEEVVRGDDDPVYRIVTHQIVRVVRAGSVVTVLDVPTKLEPFDSPHRGSPALVELQLHIAPDGRSATVRAPAAACARRRGAGATLDAWQLLDRDLRARVCASRGSHVWNRRSRRFERKRGASAPVTRTSSRP